MAKLTVREQNAVHELVQALTAAKDDALIKGYQALKDGNWKEYDLQFMAIEQIHALLKALAMYAWSDLNAKPGAAASLQ